MGSVGMKGSHLTAAVVAGIVLLASAPAHAFRCGTRIITRGDHAAKILRFCGEPAAVQTRLQQRAYVADFGRVLPGLFEDVVIEEWTYNLGPHQLMKVVRLENGYVADIKYLGYGY